MSVFHFQWNRQYQRQMDSNWVYWATLRGGEGGWLFLQANFTKVNTFPITKLRLVFKLKTELNFRINN